MANLSAFEVLRDTFLPTHAVAKPAQATRRRVERACELLADPRKSVTDIAAACGFASAEHLATVLRERLGTTPSAYWRELLS